MVKDSPPSKRRLSCWLRLAASVGVVDKADFSLIIPFDGERFHLVEQYRYPVDGRFWEFPQGAYELDPDADPTRVARGELKEETGLSAASMIRLGKLFQAYGYANQAVHVFYATDLTPGDTSPEAEEAGLVSQSFTRDEINSMIRDAKITDLATVGALTLLDRSIASE